VALARKWVLHHGVGCEESAQLGIVNPTLHVDQAELVVVLVAGVALPRAATVLATQRLEVVVDPPAEGVVEQRPQP
jgi:hypothetical protein